MLGDSPVSLYELARRDALKFSTDDQLAAEVEIARGEAEGKYGNPFDDLLGSEAPTPLKLVLQRRLKADQAAQDEAEHERKQAARLARKIPNATQSDT